MEVIQAAVLEAAEVQRAVPEAVEAQAAVPGQESQRAQQEDLRPEVQQAEPIHFRGRSRPVTSPT